MQGKTHKKCEPNGGLYVEIEEAGMRKIVKLCLGKGKKVIV